MVWTRSGHCPDIARILPGHGPDTARILPGHGAGDRETGQHINPELLPRAMDQFHLKKRHRMRSREIRQFTSRLHERLGVTLETDELDCGTSDHDTYYITGGEIIAMEIEGEPFLTLRGLLKYRPGRSFAVVDEGAVSFLYNGADVMTPGIVDADPGIVAGDLVWVREQKHGQPLVVGRALLSGPEMVSSDRGKAIKTLHYLNDPIWNLTV